MLNSLKLLLVDIHHLQHFHLFSPKSFVCFIFGYEIFDFSIKAKFKNEVIKFNREVVKNQNLLFLIFNNRCFHENMFPTKYNEKCDMKKSCKKLKFILGKCNSIH